MQGGLPLMYGPHCVGGIGVSGVQSQQDEQVSAAGVAVLEKIWSGSQPA